MKFNIRYKDLSKVLSLAETVEMPLIQPLAEMEMRGMEVDMEYAELLSKKFHKRLDKVDAQIAVELEKLKTQIEAWKLTPEANIKPKKKNGEGEGKSKVEQLEDPINLGSPTQLAILFYDILKAPVVDKKQPRATGEEALKAIGEKLHLNICELLLQRRELVKLLTTYIDAIPELAKRWPDGRVRTHFNQYGAATGRLSSSDPINFQNIPSHEKTIRMLFKAKTEEKEIEPTNDEYIVKCWTEVETVDGFKCANKLTLLDKLVVNDVEVLPIISLTPINQDIIIKV